MTLHDLSRMTEDELIEQVSLFHDELDDRNPNWTRKLFENNKWKLFEKYYHPTESLISRIGHFEQWMNGERKEDPGRLMEEIAYLAFKSVAGQDSISSAQTATAQHDLIVSGSNKSWFNVMSLLHLPKSGRTILVEAKNTRDKVSDAQFGRICQILHEKYSEQCHLGVFFTRMGASGFPNGRVQQRSLSAARLSQILFHAKTDKYVVVLDQDDILELGQPGALLVKLEAKIRDIESWLGQRFTYDDDDWVLSDVLPPHLKRHSKSL